MAELEPGTVGIVPASALGVAFFHHLTRGSSAIDASVQFLERPGSSSGRDLRESGCIRIEVEGEPRDLDAGSLLRPDLEGCHREGRLPEILLVCVNPDQILDVLAGLVRLLELAYEEGETGQWPLPTVILSANGIYFQRVRQVYLEMLEEATLLGRLPDLWPDPMTRIVGHLLRGVTIQTGVRKGNGGRAIYRPGPRGRTRVAGGEAQVRRHACELLSGKGGWFEEAPDHPPTRLEFDKALVNLASNVLGQLHALSEAGHFAPLLAGHLTGPEHAEDLALLAQQVFRVGQAVHAYGREDCWERIHAELRESLQTHASHMPSSLQWVELQLAQGTLRPDLTPTETWLLNPLIRYAKSAGLAPTTAYFERLRERLLGKLKQASARLHRRR